MRCVLLMLCTLLAAAEPRHHPDGNGRPDMPPPAHVDRCDRHPVYQRQNDLVGTLLATRSAYRAWRVRQAAALPLVRWDGWLRDDGTAVAIVDDAIVPWKQVDPLLPRQATLRRTVTAAAATRLTIGLGGGSHQRVLLDGALLLAADTARLDRAGTGNPVQDDPVLDRLLIDLPLTAGRHELRVEIRFDDPRRMVFACTTTVNPVQRLWHWLWADFPAREHLLLDAIPADWFGNDTLAPTLLASDEQQMLARTHRTNNDTLAGNRPYAALGATWSFAPPESERKPGLLHDGWFDAADTRFETALLLALGASVPTAPPDDPAWLRACTAAVHQRHLADACNAVGQAIAALAANHPGYPAAAFAGRLAELRRSAATADGPGHPAHAALAALRHEALVQRHPALAGRRLLFVKRHTYNTHHIYDDHNHGPRSFAGNLYERDLATGAERALLPQLDGGVFDRFDLSADAQRVVFAYRRPHAGGFRIYEAAVDGSWVRQLTHAPADEAERVRRHSEFTPAELAADPTLHGHWTDDTAPVYLPDGGVAFTSSRPEYSIYCGPHSTTTVVLHRVERDGSGLHQLSSSPLSELFPSLLEDGRILYTRYEYVFKGNVVVHGLWAMRPDGSGAEELYGDNIPLPPAFCHGRQVPGRPDLLVATGCGHEPVAMGAIVQIDRNQDRRSAAAMTSFTPEIAPYGCAIRHRRNGRWVQREVEGPLCADPYPLDAHTVLAAYNPDRRYNDPRGFGIWLIDRFGNRVRVCDDPAFSCFQPMLLQPGPRRHHLPALATAATPPPAPRSGQPEAEATVVLADVSHGLAGVAPGTIRHLRVVEQVPRTWDATNRVGCEYFPGSATAISLGTHIWVAVNVGVVPVEPDGSAHFTVPADRNLFFQALDADYRAVQTMRTFVNFQPGETRSCLGCHDDRSRTPEAGRGLAALARPASRPAPMPGESAVPRPIHFPSDIQPILDRRCTSCHGDAPKAGLDLRGTPDYLFTTGYNQLVERGLVAYIQEHQTAHWRRMSPYAQRFAGMEHAEVVPPYRFGAHGSRLSRVLDSPPHAGLLTPAERRELDLWMDTNAQFYGSYFGHREPRFAQTPGYRLTPDLATARGQPPFLVHPMPGAP